MRTAIRRRGPYLLLAPLLIAGVVRGYQKALEGRAEWSYWEQLVGGSWAEVTGPDSMLFGYLPGFAVLIKPFVAGPQPLGLLVFLALNVLCCAGIAHLLWSARERRGQSVPLALVLAMGIAMYHNLQNNQVVAPAVFLTILGARCIARGARWGAAAIGVAVLVKTLPVTLLAMFASLGRWRLAIGAAATFGLLSFGLSAASEGVEASYHAHLALPAQVLAQSPNRILAGAEPAPSFGVNSSLAACAVRAAPYVGNLTAQAFNLVTFFATLGLTALLTYRLRRSKDDSMALLALWLSWTVLAAPFGRYYYLLFTVPAWSVFWPEPRKERRSRAATLVPWLVALLPLAAKSTAVYVPLTIASYAVSVASLLALHRERALEAAPPESR